MARLGNSFRPRSRSLGAPTLGGGRNRRDLRPAPDHVLSLPSGMDAIPSERTALRLTGNQAIMARTEYYFYLDSNSTHQLHADALQYRRRNSLMHICRREPARGGKRRNLNCWTRSFHENRYRWLVEYAKADVGNILIESRFRIAARKRPRAHAAQLWFRNTWSWGRDLRRPVARKGPVARARASSCSTGNMASAGCCAPGSPTCSSRENETNNGALFSEGTAHPMLKDAFHEYVIRGNMPR